VVGVARMVRFTALGVLALLFGRKILRWAENPVLQDFLIGLIVVCTVGSVISVYGWIRRSRAAVRPRDPDVPRAPRQVKPALR
jgi:hypothetical protein